MATENSDSSHTPPDEDHKARISSIRSLVLDDLKEKLFSCLQTKSDDPLFTLRDASNSSAKCWSQFQHVYEKKKGIAFVAQEWGFVACTKCGKVYSYRSAHGTSTLTKHVKKDCAKSSLAKTRSITEYLGTQKLSGSDKKRIIEAVSRMRCTDMRPFNIVSGVGFREFTRVVFEIGFRSQRLCGATDLLPVPNTVRNNVQDDADLIRTKLVQICLEHFGGRCGAGFTADLWTDSIRKRTYLSLTFHYLTVTFELHARALQVKEIEGISHTAPVLLGAFSESLADFGIVDTSKCTAVTDCGSNLCGSHGLPSKYKWIPCADHKIAILITTVLSKTTATEAGTVSAPFYKYYDEAPEIYELLDRCKALVGYVKKSKLQKQLEFTLKQENVTRWNSQLVMFESILKSYDEVTELLAQRGKSVYISCIDKELLEELVRFLLPFREATCTLEKWKDPTLHLVVHERHKLMTLLQPQLDRVMIDKKKKHCARWTAGYPQYW